MSTVVPLLLLSLVPAPAMAAAPASVRVVVGEVALAAPPSVQPFLENGVTMVPAQTFLRALGADVTGNDQWVTAQRSCQSVSLANGASNLNVDGQALRMPVPAREVNGELFVPLNTVAEALDIKVEWNGAGDTALVIPPAAQSAGLHQARLTLTIRQAGHLTVPAALQGEPKGQDVGPGSYQWILDPASAGRIYTWTFRPAGRLRIQTFSVTHNGSAYVMSKPTADISPSLDEATLLYQWEIEHAARTRLGRPTAPLTADDLGTVTALTLPARDTSVTELCRFPKLSDLELEEQGAQFSAELVQAAAVRAPSLRSLTFRSAADLEPDPAAAATKQLPYRVETPHGIFLGDQGMDMPKLAQYASRFEKVIVGELERDTGLRPTSHKAVFVIYGDEAYWNRVTDSSPFWGYYSAQEHRVHMAHWKSPESINSLLMTHEMFHWLAWEEGKVNLPTWLNEGLAHNLSWRIEQGADTWLNPFVKREWLRVRAAAATSIPALATHTAQDEYTITAVAHLLQTRGRDALVPFFERTRSGAEFTAAFQEAFGLTPAAFEKEYDAQVLLLRKAQ